jgi:hypothetical protein
MTPTEANEVIRSGKAYRINLSPADDEEDIIAELIDAERGRAELCLIHFGDDSGWHYTGKDLAGLKKVCEYVAVNAKTYMKKPLIFSTNEPELLETGLKNYCGIAGAAMPGGGSRDESALIKTTSKYRAVIL